MPPCSPPEIVIQDGVTVISLGAEYESLEEAQLDQLRELLLATVQQADPPWVVLDLSHTRFFGSSFIEVMFRLANRIEARQGRFAISGLTPYCAEVLRVTHLDRLWRTYPNRDAAIAALAKA